MTEASHSTIHTDDGSTDPPKSIFSLDTLGSLGSALRSIWNGSESQGRSNDHTKSATLGSDDDPVLAKRTEVNVYVDHTDDVEKETSHAALVVSGSVTGKEFRYAYETSQSRTGTSPEDRVELVETALIKEVKSTIFHDMIRDAGVSLLVAMTLTAKPNDADLSKLEYRTGCVWQTGDDGKPLWKAKKGGPKASIFDLVVVF